MVIISVRDDENNRWKRSANEKANKTEKTRGTKAKVKGWELSDCCTFKLGFLQLICKDSLIFKSNLKLVLSITLKERVKQSLLQVKACCKLIQAKACRDGV